jgi:hypothetical protein
MGTRVLELISRWEAMELVAQVDIVRLGLFLY